MPESGSPVPVFDSIPIPPPHRSPPLARGTRTHPVPDHALGADAAPDSRPRRCRVRRRPDGVPALQPGRLGGAGPAAAKRLRRARRVGSALPGRRRLGPLAATAGAMAGPHRAPADDDLPRPPQQLFARRRAHVPLELRRRAQPPGARPRSAARGAAAYLVRAAPRVPRAAAPDDRPRGSRSGRMATGGERGRGLGAVVGRGRRGTRRAQSVSGASGPLASAGRPSDRIRSARTSTPCSLTCGVRRPPRRACPA